jgi:nitrate reductase NapAB chaperone NapD
MCSSTLVVVQDLPSVEEHMEGLRRIQALPQVLVAELVYHRSEPGEENEEARFTGEG